jgi:hypothetical protein
MVCLLCNSQNERVTKKGGWSYRTSSRATEKGATWYEIHAFFRSLIAFDRFRLICLKCSEGIEDIFYMFRSLNHLQKSPFVVVLAASATSKLKKAPSMKRVLKTRKDLQDLNEKVSLNLDATVDERRSMQMLPSIRNVSISFDDIPDKVSDIIKRTPFVVGCMAWLSDPKILLSLSLVRGVSVIVTNDAMLSNHSLLVCYSRIPAFVDGEAAIRYEIPVSSIVFSK